MLRCIKLSRRKIFSLRMLCLLAIALIVPLLACNDTVDEMIEETAKKAQEKADAFSGAVGGRGKKVEEKRQSASSLEPILTIQDTAIKFSGNNSNIADIPIHISGAPDVAGIQFELLYDPTLLQFEDIIPGRLIKDFIFEAGADRTRGLISVAAIGTRDVKGTGEIAIAKFRPLKEGKLRIDIQNLVIADSDIKPIRINHKPGNIIIENPDQRMPGKLDTVKPTVTPPSRPSVKPRR